MALQVASTINDFADSAMGRIPAYQPRDAASEMAEVHTSYSHYDEKMVPSSLILCIRR